MNTRLIVLALMLLTAGSLVAAPTLGAPSANTAAAAGGGAVTSEASGAGEAPLALTDSSAAIDINAARSKWATMEPAQRQRVLRRWNELRSLDDESRQRVMSNFNLIREATAERRDPDHWRKPEYAHRVEHYVSGFDEAHRERIRSLHGEIKRVRVDEPSAWAQFQQMTPEQQREAIDDWRNKMMRRQAEWMAEYLDLTVEQQAELLEVLQRVRQESDLLHQRQFDALRKVDREFRKELLEICNGDEEQARLLEQRLQMLGNHSHRRGAPSQDFPPLPHDTMRRFGFGGTESWMNAAWEVGIRDAAIIDALSDIYSRLEKSIATLLYEAMVAQEPPSQDQVERRLGKARDAMAVLAIEPEQLAQLMELTLKRIAERLRDGGRGYDRARDHRRGGRGRDSRNRDEDRSRDDGDRDDGDRDDGDRDDGDRDDRDWNDRDDRRSNGDPDRRDGDPDRRD